MCVPGPIVAPKQRSKNLRYLNKGVGLHAKKGRTATQATRLTYSAREYFRAVRLVLTSIVFEKPTILESEVNCTSSRGFAIRHTLVLGGFD